MIDLIAVAGALMLASTQAESRIDVAAPDETRPVWTIDARRAPLSDVVRQLQEAGVSVVGEPADADRLVSGEFTGELSVVMARVLRNEDFTLSQAENGYEVRFLSGVEGTAGARPAPRRENAAAPVRTAMPAERPASAVREDRSEASVGALLDARLAQAAVSEGEATGRAYSPRTAGPGEAAAPTQPGSADAEQIAAMNARAAAQLSALVTALRASCPAGSSCD